MVQNTLRSKSFFRQTGVRYLYRYNNRFYFRYIPPEAHRDLSKRIPKQIKLSLRTSTKSIALARLSRLSSLIEQIPSVESIVELEHVYNQLKSTDTLFKSSLSHLKKSSTLSLREAWSSFLIGKNWSEKRLKTVEQMFQNIECFLGNEAIDSYQSADMEDALKSISKLPQRNRSPYNQMTLNEAAETDVPDRDRVSDKTVKEHLKLMVSLFSTHLCKERKLIAVSPTDGVRYKVNDKRFGAFTDSEVSMILARSEDKPEWFRWFCLLGAYTGARRSELARLTKADIHTCPDSHRVYFKVTKGKTKAAERVVPLSLQVLEVGFLDYMGNLDSEELFPLALKNPNRVTDLFGSLVPNPTDAYGDRLVFHSLRHTFITKARMAGASRTAVQQYVGHSISGGGITDRYTHRFNVEKLAQVCDAVHY